MIKKISFKKIHNFFKKYYPWILGIIFILLISLDVFIYYQYVYLTMKARPEITDEGMVINQEILQEVLNNLDKREETLFRVKTTQYADPFR